MTWIQFQHPEIVFSGPVCIPQRAGVKIPEAKMDARFGRMPGEKLFKLVGSVAWITGKFQSQAKIETGLERARLQGQGRLVSGECPGQVAQFIGGDTQIIVGIEVGGIRTGGLFIKLDGFCQPVSVVQSHPFGHQLFGLSMIAFGQDTNGSVTVARWIGRGGVLRFR